MITVVLPATMDSLASALIDLMSDAKRMSEITVQTGEDLRAQEADAHQLGQYIGVWRSVVKGSATPHFGEQVDVVSAAMPQSKHINERLSDWRHNARLSHSAVVEADRAAKDFLDWAQAAEPAYGEAADEAGVIAASFDGVSKAAATWVETVRSAKHAGTVEAAKRVADVKAGLHRQVSSVADLYKTIHERGAALYDAVGVRPSRHHIYDARLTVAEHVESCVSICDGLERYLSELAR